MNLSIEITTGISAPPIGIIKKNQLKMKQLAVSKINLMIVLNIINKLKLLLKSKLIAFKGCCL